MWQPTETCERCGSERIGLVEDRDDSVGYHSEEWRCLACGANCEVWIPLRKPAAAETSDAVLRGEVA